jgi:hypothetical protein
MKALAEILSHLKHSGKTVFISVVSVVAATNLLYYAVIDVSHAHVYNFFLISVFILVLFRLFSSRKNRYLHMAAIVAGIITIARPSNGLVILLTPFVAGGFDPLRKILQDSRFIISLLLFLSVLFIPSLLWFLQTEKWYVYSYGAETFHFSDPHLFDNLFSYRKGLFTYTPAALLALTGLVHFFKEDRFRFFSLGIFLILLCYVISSWWCWWYGCGIGQRAYVDYYSILGILFASMIAMLSKNKNFKSITIAILLFLIPLNILRLYQHKSGIFPCDSADREFFWSHFFTTDASYSDAIPVESIAGSKPIRSFSPEIGSMPCHVTPEIPFGSSIVIPLNEISADSSHSLYVTADIATEENLDASRLVISYENSGGSYHYKAHYLKDRIEADQKTVMSFIEPMVALHGKNDSLKIYFWNGDSGEKFTVNSFEAKIFKKP